MELTPHTRIILLAILLSQVIPVHAQEKFPPVHDGPVPLQTWKAKDIEEDLLPLSVDNNQLKYFPPILNQIGGSCAQASTIGYMCTYELNRLLDSSASSPSHRCSYLYSWNFINEGRDEGSLGWDGLNLAYNAGLMSEEDFPKQRSSYEFRWASGYEKYYRALHNKVVKFNDIELTSEEGIRQVKQYLYNKNEKGKPGGIVIFSSLARGWEFDDHYTGPSETGIRSLLIRLGTDGPHGMTITGYDDLVEFTDPEGNLHSGAFIVTNTHGSSRHDKGRFYLPYWFFLQKRNQNVLGNSVTGAQLEYQQPLIVFRVEFEYSSRDDLSFKIGVSGNVTDTLPLHNYIVPILNHQGGDHPMQGYGADSQMDVAFDFTPYLQRLDGIKEPNFFLTITRGKRGQILGKGKLYRVSVYDYRQDADHPIIYVKDCEGKEIAEGNTIISIPTTPVPQTSFSPIKWLDHKQNPVNAPLIFRTAKGRYAKVRFSEYDPEKGTLRIRYVYNPNRNRKLK